MVESTTAEVDQFFTTPTRSTRATPMEGTLALQDAPEHAVGEPRSFHPAAPLFSEKQTQRLKSLKEDHRFCNVEEIVKALARWRKKAGCWRWGLVKGKVMPRSPEDQCKAFRSEQWASVLQRGKLERSYLSLVSSGRESCVKNEALEGRFHTPEEEKPLRSSNVQVFVMEDLMEDVTSRRPVTTTRGRGG